MSNFYFHERTDRTEQGPLNLVWPLMDTGVVTLDAVKKYFAERKLDYSLAEENGWYPSRHAGDAFLRVVIPAQSTKDKHVYWQARSINSDAFVRYQSPKGPREGALIVVQAFPRRLLFRTKTLSKQVVIVEGPMDALASAMCGYDAIATMGIQPGAKALQHLQALVCKRPALVAFDNEPAASSAAHSVAMALASVGGKVRCITLPEYKDLAACPQHIRLRFLQAEREDLG